MNEFYAPHWYAAYTKANHEKRVAKQLSERLIENFVPLYDSKRRWKDRCVVLQVPIFPGYVFVRMSVRDRLRVLQVPGVARLVGFNGTPATLPEAEIAALRAGLANGAKAEPHPFLVVGHRVCLKTGPFRGMAGVLLRHKGKCRVVVSIHLLKQAVAVEVIDTDLTSVP